jgi:hypothetical protein
MGEPRIIGSWEDVGRKPQLLDTPKSLEGPRSDDLEFEIAQSDGAVDRIGHEFGVEITHLRVLGKQVSFSELLNSLVDPRVEMWLLLADRGASRVVIEVTDGAQIMNGG